MPRTLVTGHGLVDANLLGRGFLHVSQLSQYWKLVFRLLGGGSGEVINILTQLCTLWTVIMADPERQNYGYRSGMAVIRVTNHFLILFKAYSIEVYA